MFWRVRPRACSKQSIHHPFAVWHGFHTHHATSSEVSYHWRLGTKIWPSSLSFKTNLFEVIAFFTEENFRGIDKDFALKRTFPTNLYLPKSVSNWLGHVLVDNDIQWSVEHQNVNTRALQNHAVRQGVDTNMVEVKCPISRRDRTQNCLTQRCQMVQTDSKNVRMNYVVIDADVKYL